MTWVIGIAPTAGQGIMVSDIRVTFKSGNVPFLDCLQKIHYIGRFAVAGFAGSVKIGFRQIDMMKFEFSKVEADKAWDIEAANAWWLPRLMRRIFARSERREKDAGSALLIVAAHPNKNMLGLPMPLIQVFKYEAPKYVPQMADLNVPMSIGSGSAIDAYSEALTALTNRTDFITLLNLGSQAQALALHLQFQESLKKHPSVGISSATQIAFVTHKPSNIFDLQLSTYEEDGKETTKPFPKTADTYRDFLRLYKENQPGQEAPTGAIA